MSYAGEVCGGVWEVVKSMLKRVREGGVLVLVDLFGAVELLLAFFNSTS